MTRYLMGVIFSVSFFNTIAQAPAITGNRYDAITKNSVTLHWEPSVPADSRVFWMVSDSNDQPIAYTDSARIDSLFTAHSVCIGNPQPAVMYRYLIRSVGVSGSDFATVLLSPGQHQRAESLCGSAIQSIFLSVPTLMPT